VTGPPRGLTGGPTGPRAGARDEGREAVAASGLARLRDPAALADPYPVYAAWRRLEEQDPGAEEIARILVRHADVRAALRDPRLSSWRVPAIMGSLSPAAQERLVPLREHVASILVFNDPPAHRRLRALLGGAFSARTVAWLAPQVDALVAGLLDRVRGGGTWDLVAQLAFPLPALVVGAMLGIPRADLPRFERWARDLVFFVGSGARDDALGDRMQDSVLEAQSYLADLCAARRADPGDDLLSAMLAARDGDAGGLTATEVYANAQFLLTAGHETATNLLALTVLALLEHPDQLARLRADPALLPTAVDEGLRHGSPVQLTARIATEDGDLAGRPLRRGQSVVLALGAANRDPDVFADPDRFDVGRSPNPLLAFGHGVHFCLGAPLARLESAAVLRALLDGFPRLALAVDPAELEWQATTDFRGPVRLPVTS